MGMLVRCPSCGRARELTACEVAKIKQDGEFVCGNSDCGATMFKYELVECKLPEGYFVLEDELYCPIRKGLAEGGASVWNCVIGRVYRCRDPVPLLDQFFVPWGADIPFMWRDEYYVLEVKLDKNRVEYDKRHNFYSMLRRVAVMTRDQVRSMSSKGGIFVMVAEPFIGGSFRTKAGAERALSEVWGDLVEDRKKYSVLILPFTIFRSLAEKYLPSGPEFHKFFGGWMEDLNQFALEGIIPNFKPGDYLFSLSKSEIMAGGISRIIFDVIERKEGGEGKLLAQCPNCGRIRELAAWEVARIEQDGEFVCGDFNCGATMFKYEKVDCKLPKGYFEKEEDLYCPIMNGLVDGGASVWNCRTIGRNVKCHEPVPLLNQTFVPWGVDIPVIWRGEYYVVEIKFERGHIFYDKDFGFWEITPRSARLTSDQVKCLKSRGGIFVMIAEPPISRKFDSEEEAESYYRKVRRRLVDGRLRYTMIIIPFPIFKIFAEKYLPQRSFTEKKFTFWIEHLNKLVSEDIIPNWDANNYLFSLSKSEIMAGQISKIIFDTIQWVKAKNVDE